MSERIASAVFDSENEAQRAFSELQSAGINQDAISIVGRHGEQSSSGGSIGGSNDGDDDGVHEGGAAKGAIGGAVGGALLGVAALAIPGVGPLAAAGAIASGAIPGAAAIGAGVGAVGGGLTGLLTDHGVSNEDASYYEDRIHSGGIFLSVDADRAGVPLETAREILFRNGGHNASQQRTTTAAI
ncbi:hypothetical protein ACUXST_000677 [Sphingomonas sp. F9_3S_D5_B_2]